MEDVKGQRPTAAWVAPGARLMAHLPFGQKVALLLGIAGLVLASLLAAYLWQATRDLQALQREREGLRVLEQARPAARALAAWIVEALAHGQQGSSLREAQARQSLLGALNAMADGSARAMRPPADADGRGRLIELLQGFEWNAVQRDTNLAKVRQVIQAWRQWENAVLDVSGLLRDPDPLTFALTDAALIRIRGLQDALELAGPTVLDTLESGKLSGPGRAVVMRALVDIERHDEELRARLDRIVELDPALGEPLAPGTLKELLPYLVRRLEADIVLLPRADEDLLATLKRDLQEAQVALERLGEACRAALNKRLEARLLALRAEVTIQVAVAALAVLAVSYLALAFYADTHQGVRAAHGALGRLAQGDLRQPPTLTLRRDEIGQIVRYVGHAQDNLRELLQGLADTARELSASSQAMGAVAAELQQRNDHAAQSLRQQTAVLDHVGQGLAQTTNQARETEQFAQDNARMARDSRQLVQSLTQVMGDIQRSGQRIAEITDVIDGLAFQTNILALNAAVEAARAGEAGRGFAVVAAEVRSLALRSAEAARQIRGQIEESVRLVDGGVRVVGEAGRVMKQLIANAESINGFVSDIAASAHAQSQQLAGAVAAAQTLVRDSEEGVAMVERTGDTAQRLALQSQILMRGLERFRL